MADQITRYYTAADSRVFVNDVWVDEAFSIGYTQEDPKIPIYGYADVEFQAVAQGKRIVQGELTMNYRNQNALSLLLMQGGGSVTMEELRREMNIIQGDPPMDRWKELQRSINGAISGLPPLDQRLGTVIDYYLDVIYKYCHQFSSAHGTTILGIKQYGLGPPDVYAPMVESMRDYGVTDAEIKKFNDLIVVEFDTDWNAALGAGTTEWDQSPNNSTESIAVLQHKNDVLVRHGFSQLKKKEGLLFDLGIAEEFKSRYWNSGDNKRERYAGLPNVASISRTRPAQIDIYLGELPNVVLKGQADIDRRSGYKISLIDCIFTGEQFIMAQGMNDHAKISYSFFAKRVTP